MFNDDIVNNTAYRFDRLSWDLLKIVSLVCWVLYMSVVHGQIYQVKWNSYSSNKQCEKKAESKKTLLEENIQGKSQVDRNLQ